MKIITFNVNGLRSVLTKKKDGSKLNKEDTANNILYDLLKEQDPDILCLQEVRCNETIQFDFSSLGYIYNTLNCSTSKKGYSGTGIISKIKPYKIYLGLSEFDKNHEINTEGRIITVEFDKCFIVNAYVPNSKEDLSRLKFRTDIWETSMRNHINKLQNQDKPVIYCGDLNVAAADIDVHNPKTAKGVHGFTIEEKNSFNLLLNECNLIDSFREKHPKTKDYSWYSAIARGRSKGKGWRIDYLLISYILKERINKASILSEYYGSDHVPCLLELAI